MAQVNAAPSEEAEQTFRPEVCVESADTGQAYLAKLEVLRAAIDHGFASGIAEDGVFERIRAALPK